jgi:hypothetical protein
MHIAHRPSLLFVQEFVFHFVGIHRNTCEVQSLQYLIMLRYMYHGYICAWAVRSESDTNTRAHTHRQGSKWCCRQYVVLPCSVCFKLDPARYAIQLYNMSHPKHSMIMYFSLNITAPLLQESWRFVTDPGGLVSSCNPCHEGTRTLLSERTTQAHAVRHTRTSKTRHTCFIPRRPNPFNIRHLDVLDQQVALCIQCKKNEVVYAVSRAGLPLQTRQHHALCNDLERITQERFTEAS